MNPAGDDLPARMGRAVGRERENVCAFRLAATLGYP